jgi:hypothetical protein
MVWIYVQLQQVGHQMIRITTLSAADSATILPTPEDHSVRIWVTGRTDLLKLQALIHRALNTAPEFGADWFKLAADLEKFIAEQGIK